jgi:truncated hemoglobin YjbI
MSLDTYYRMKQNAEMLRARTELENLKSEVASLKRTNALIDWNGYEPVNDHEILSVLAPSTWEERATERLQQLHTNPFTSPYTQYEVRNGRVKASGHWVKSFGECAQFTPWLPSVEQAAAMLSWLLDDELGE